VYHKTGSHRITVTLTSIAIIGKFHNYYDNYGFIMSIYTSRMSFYLIFQVYMLSWIERKAAAALYATPPSSTAEEAVVHFLKVT
jgi:hypothetical protein